MKPQYQHQVMSSFVLWLDNKILSKGEAFQNESFLFHPSPDRFDGLFTYAAPFKQLVSDQSISGADVPTGVFLNGTFIGVGEEGLTAINYDQGQIYFDNNKDADIISGDFAVKDIDIMLTEFNEEEILFETKLHVRPRVTEEQTGLPLDTITYPVAMIKPDGGDTEPFCFGGTDMTKNNIRVMVLSDSQWLLDGFASIMKDEFQNRFALIFEESQPLNALGGFKDDIPYNYTGLVDECDPNVSVFLKNVFVSKINNSSVNKAFTQINKDVYVTFIDFELEDIRQT